MSVADRLQVARTNRIWRRVILPLLAVAILALYQYSLERGETTPPGDLPHTGAVEGAYADRRSGVWVEVNGSIRRRLPVDNTGSVVAFLFVQVIEDEADHIVES